MFKPSAKGLFVSILVLIFLIVTAHLQVQAQHQLQVLPTESGIRIILIKPDVSLRLISSGSYCAWIKNKHSTFSTENNAPALQKYRLYLAVPQTGELPTSLNVQHTRSLGNVQLAGAKDVIESTSTFLSTINQPRYKATMGVTLRRMGVERGVSVAELEIQPFTYTSDGELYVLDTATVDISFSTQLPFTTQKLPPLDQSSFAHLANQSQIPALLTLNKTNNRKTEITLQSKDLSISWYNVTTTYVRISTTTDGVARLQAKDILSAAPEWNGLSSNGLHLLYKGNEIPIGYAQDDGKIGADDEIYFIGQRAKGDSTWRSYLTDETVYYLYFDTSIISKRFSQFPEVTNPSGVIQSVIINNHIEEDHFFHAGDYGFLAEESVFRTETLNNEGFYWSMLANNFGAAPFTYQMTITPSDVDTDSLNIQVGYHTITLNDAKNNPMLAPNYSLLCSLNGLQNQRKSVSGIITDISSFTLYPSTAVAGINTINFKSLPVPNDTANQLRISSIYIDYLTVSGKVKPFADNGKADWKVDTLTANSLLPIKDLRSEHVIIIDTNHSYFSLKKATSGTSVRASAIAGSSLQTSLIINSKTIVNTDSAGLFVAICDAPGFSLVRSRRFTAGAADLQAYIESAPNGSIIAATINDSLSISSSTISIFMSLGSKEISALVPRTSWTACFQKGTGLVAERRGTIASVAEFISHANGLSYQTALALSANMTYAIEAADRNSAEVSSVSREPVSNLQDTTPRFDAIILTHPKFQEQANRLAKHRSSQGWKVTVVSVLDIYKEFYAGEKSPFAIRKFLQFAYQKWQKPAPAYLTIMGDASWDPRKNLYGAINEDYVPTYGYPTSDFWYTLLDGNDYLPEMVVGRLPVNTTEEATAVVDKLIEYDSLPSAPWKKRFMFLSGPRFETNFESVEDYVLMPPLCGDTIRIGSEKTSSVDYTKTTKIRTAINNGVLWLTFNGHSSPDFFELDGWRVEDLNNISRYNILTTYSCTSGEYAKPDGVCRNESYITAARKGSIAAFGNTGLGISAVDATVFFGMFKTVSEDTLRRLGDILKSAKYGFEREASGLNMMMQHLLLGDPLTRLALDNKSDMYMTNQEVTIATSLGNSTLNETDSLAIVAFKVRNAGVNESRDIPLLIIHRYDGGTDSVRMTIGELCSSIDLSTSFLIFNRAGTHSLTFIIDPDTTLNESRINNNMLSLTFEVFSAGMSPLDPRPFWDVSSTNPAFRFVVPQPISRPEYEFRIEKEGSSGTAIVELKSTSASSQLHINELYIEWLPNIELQAGESYTLLSRIKNTDNGRISDWLKVPFYALTTLTTNTAQWRQKSKSELLSNPMNNLSAMQVGDSTGLRLNNFKLPVVAYSCGGGGGFRYGRTIVGQHEYSASVDQTSFSITHLPPNDTIGVHRDFYTFDNRNLNCNTVVRYLRDSIADGEVVIITAADACFNGFAYNHPDSIGFKTNLIKVMKEIYFSNLIDSIFYGTSYPSGREFDPFWRYLASWSIIARKGDSMFKKVEKFNSRFDTVTVRDTIQFYTFNGELSSPLIGPAYAWNTASILSSIPKNSTVMTQVYGKSSQSDPELLLRSSDSTQIYLGTISAQEFPFLRLNTQLKRTQYTAEPTISGFQLAYTPTVEYTVIPSSISRTPDNILRGDSSLFTVAITNIAKRGNADTSSVIISIDAVQGAGVPLLHRYTLPLIVTNEIHTFYDSIASNETAIISRIKTTIDDKASLHELYRFNNIGSELLHVHEDTLKPRVQLIVDGIAVRDGDFVAPKPRFEILVRDNSQLVIDSGKIRVRINRFLQPDTTTREARFTHVKGNGDLRVNFTFITHRLEEGENFVQIITEDASANKDTLRLNLHVAKFATISSNLVVPNPTVGATSIRFNYAGQLQNVPATLDIFDMSGQFTRTLTTTAHIGTNSFEWDGNDSFGEIVPPGVYVYRLNLKADSYTDTLFGKIMMSR